MAMSEWYYSSLSDASLYVRVSVTASIRHLDVAASHQPGRSSFAIYGPVIWNGLPTTMNCRWTASSRTDNILFLQSLSAWLGRAFVTAIRAREQEQDSLHHLLLVNYSQTCFGHRAFSDFPPPSGTVYHWYSGTHCVQTSPLYLDAHCYRRSTVMVSLSVGRVHESSNFRTELTWQYHHTWWVSTVV